MIWWAKKGKKDRNTAFYISKYSDLQRYVSTYLWFKLFAVPQIKRELQTKRTLHRNSKRLPHNTLPQAVNEDVKNFLTNHVEENVVLLPGRIPGFKKDDIRLLSSSETKMNVWRTFKRTCEESGKHAVCYTTFVKLWEQFHPDVVVAKPMTDLCLTCQQNTSKLLRSANLPEQEKSECVIAQQGHLTCVKMERDFYNNICTESQSNFKRFEERIKLDEKNKVCSIDTTIHYSFDFAQQIQILSNPMQPGPIYFKTPRKCGIFGVVCEAISLQVNYLIDKASDVGKGANTTVSFVHHYFHDYGLGETNVHLLPIITQDNIKITFSSGTCRGEKCISFITPSVIPF